MTRAEKDERILSVLSGFLNRCPDAIDRDALSDMGMDDATGYAALVCAFAGADDTDTRLVLDDCRRIFTRYQIAEFAEDEYLKRLSGIAGGRGNIDLRTETLKPYEAFVCGDLSKWPDGAVLPKLGWFTQAFSYPALSENGRIWMTVTPNEILTVSKPARAARGNVLTLGLGLGYFVLHALLNPAVTSVTALEKNRDVIEIFDSMIRPRLPQDKKLCIIKGDAFEEAPRLYASGRYDYVFADLWHDASDGADMYLRLKSLEVSGPQYSYWIEDTLRYYI